MSTNTDATDAQYHDTTGLDTDLDGPEATADADRGPTMKRRRMMQATAVGVASLATMGIAGANPDHNLNYDSQLVPDVYIPATATIAESGPEMGPLEYIDNDDNQTSLATFGAEIAPPEADDEPHNPVMLRADHVAAAEYYAYPRGVTYDDGDDEDAELSVLDAEHWTSDAELELLDASTPAGETGLNASTDGNTGSATATFDEADLDSGVDRTYLQVGYTVNSIDDTAVVRIHVHDDSGGTRTVRIEDGADTSQAAVIGTGDETAAVRQVELGELDGALEAITEIELEIADADADIDLFAFNAERSSRWEFGTEEIVAEGDDDADVQTTTVYEPTGTYDISDYGTLPSMITDSDIDDLQVEVEFRASNLPADRVEVMFEAADRFTEDQRFHLVQNAELPDAYDLELDVGNVYDTQRYQQSQYNTAEVLVGDHDVIGLTDLDDHDFNSRRSAYDVGIDEEVQLSSMASQGDMVTVHFDLLVSDNQAESIQDVGDGGGFFGGGGREGGGITDRIFSIPGVILGGLGSYGVLRYFGWVPGVGGQ